MSRQHGFTLVEVVIALSITSVLFVLLFDGLRTGQRAGLAVEQRNERADALGSAERFFRQHLQQALPVADDARGSPAGAVAFDGARHHLSFVAAMPMRSGQGGLFRFSVGMDEQNGQLWLRYRHYRDALREGSSNGTDEQDEMVLLDHIGALEFAYLEREPGGTARWHYDWQRRDRLPALVRVHFAGDSPAFTRELLIVPRVEALS